jgi:hypothetical protein
MRRASALAAMILLLATPAFALDMPTRKAGLWEVKMVFEGRNLPVQAMQQCTDASSDKVMNANFGGSAQQTCAKQDMQHVGSTIVVDSVCTFGQATTTTHAVVTGSFDSAYSVDVSSTRQGGATAPGMPATGQSHMKIEAKWLGPCAAGQKPGDIIMGNGLKMNVLEMQKMRGMPPKR